MQSHIRKVHACLAVTCHLHFWQNDWDLLRAAAVTRGWNGYQNESAQKVDPGKETAPTAPAGIRTCDLSVTSPVLKTLSYPHSQMAEIQKLLGVCCDRAEKCLCVTGCEDWLQCEM